MSKSYDLIVIGAGPGGYVAAVRAAQLGLKCAVVERAKPGGVCLNWGCIPSKNLIHQAEQFHSLKAMESVGVTVDCTGFDYAKVQANSRAVVKTLTGGVRGLLRKNGVELLHGRGRISGKGEVTVANEEGEEKFRVGTILVQKVDPPALLGRPS